GRLGTHKGVPDAPLAGHDARRSLYQFSGSSLMIEAPWLLPTQKVTGVVVLSTNTRRMLVERGSRYSTNWPVLGSSRETRSFIIDPVHTSPFLSSTTS